MDVTKFELIDSAFEEGLLNRAHPQVNDNCLFYAYHTTTQKGLFWWSISFQTRKYFHLMRTICKTFRSQPYWITTRTPAWTRWSSLPFHWWGNARSDIILWPLSAWKGYIDVDSKSGALPTAFHLTIPLLANPDTEEIWAYGLRNPWRLHWILIIKDCFADVGYLWEEVNLIEKGEITLNLREGVTHFPEPWPNKTRFHRTHFYMGMIMEQAYGGCVYSDRKNLRLRINIFWRRGTGNLWALRLLEEQEVSRERFSSFQIIKKLTKSLLLKRKAKVRRRWIFAWERKEICSSLIGKEWSIVWSEGNGGFPSHENRFPVLCVGHGLHEQGQRIKNLGITTSQYTSCDAWGINKDEKTYPSYKQQQEQR